MNVVRVVFIEAISRVSCVLPGAEGAVRQCSPAWAGDRVGGSRFSSGGDVPVPCRQAAPPTVLSAIVSDSTGCRSERTRDSTPLRAPRRAVWQMDDDTPYGAFEPRAELEQPFTKRGDLSPSTRGAGRAKPQLLHQYIGRRSEDHPQLISPEARAVWCGRWRARNAAP